MYTSIIQLSADHGTGIINRLVRFTDVNNTAENRVTLVDNIPASAGFHSGGAIAFGPDDKLYVGIGDATFSELAQNPTILLGKVLRELIEMARFLRTIQSRTLLSIL